ncbi:hypothetical protein ACFL2O_10120 [Thermodesulfobacteriota bacterium]
MCSKNLIISITVATFFLSILTVSCASFEASDKSKQTANHTELKVSFVDQTWNGKTIPKGQQCQCFGGKNPMTTTLKVNNIPPKANVIVMEYSDRSFGPMDNGGHGIIGYKIKQGIRSVVIPSVAGHSFELPDGFFIISPHKGSWWCKAGAYQPPCSGGKNNSYYVTIKATYQSSNKKEDIKLFGKTVLELGIY